MDNHLTEPGWERIHGEEAAELWLRYDNLESVPVGDDVQLWGHRASRTDAEKRAILEQQLVFDHGQIEAARTFYAARIERWHKLLEALPKESMGSNDG